MPDLDREVMEQSTEEYVEALQRVIRSAVVNGYHSCDETVQAVDEPPRGGCKCWVAEAKSLVPIEGE